MKQPMLSRTRFPTGGVANWCFCHVKAPSMGRLNLIRCSWRTLSRTSPRPTHSCPPPLPDRSVRHPVRRQDLSFLVPVIARSAMYDRYSSTKRVLVSHCDCVFKYLLLGANRNSCRLWDYEMIFLRPKTNTIKRLLSLENRKMIGLWDSVFNDLCSRYWLHILWPSCSSFRISPTPTRLNLASCFSMQRRIWSSFRSTLLDHRFTWEISLRNDGYRFMSCFGDYWIYET